MEQMKGLRIMNSAILSKEQMEKCMLLRAAGFIRTIANGINGFYCKPFTRYMFWLVAIGDSDACRSLILVHAEQELWLRAGQLKGNGAR